MHVHVDQVVNNNNKPGQFQACAPEYYLATMLSGLKRLSLTTTYVILYWLMFIIIKPSSIIFNTSNILQTCKNLSEFLNLKIKL